MLHRTTPRRARARLVITGLGAAALFVVFYVFFNLTVLGQSLENSWAWQYEPWETVGFWLDRHDLPPLSFDRQTIIIGTVLTALIAAAQKHRRTAVWVAVAIPTAVLASEGFKSVFPRPLLVDSRDDAVSYPSGHAVIVLAVATAVLVVVPEKWLRWTVPLLGMWMALTTSAIVVTGHHRPSEIAGAALLVVAVFTLVGAAALSNTAARRGAVETPADGRTEATSASVTPKVSNPVFIVALVVVAALFSAWGALPWITFVDGISGAAASLFVMVVGLTVRSWTWSSRPTMRADSDANAALSRA